jgi:hypothetical protein
LCDSEKPFILATQAKQVFYIVYPSNKKGSIVVPGKTSIFGIGDVEIKEEYDAFEESPPFINPKFVDGDNVDVGYMHVDHTEEIHLN